MIVIVSDIHDNLPNLKNALDYANSIKADALFVLGDLTNSETLAYLATNFSNPIYIVQGNGELYATAELKKYPQIINLGRSGGLVKIGTKLVGLCHEPSLIDNLILKCHSRAGGNLDYNKVDKQSDFRLASLSGMTIFYGHTHKPWEEYKSGIKLVNPGNLCNVRYAPTFAVWNETTDELELKIL